jgi:RNA-binding protein
LPIPSDVKKVFAGLYARTFCHATEDIDRVRHALTNTVGNTDVRTSKTEGLHGNPILILDASVASMDEISAFFEKLSNADIERLSESLESRIDDGCNLFMRVDKQAALEGSISLTAGEDVISIRVKIVAYPSRPEIALISVREFLEGESSRRTSLR